MKTRKGVGSGNKKALNYGKQERETANENVAGTQNYTKAPATKPVNSKNPPHGRCKPPLAALGSLSNHDDNGNKNPTNLHI